MRASFAVVALVAAVGLNLGAYAGDSALDKQASLEIGVKLIDQETKQFLEEFKADPKKAIAKKKIKFNSDGTQIAFDAQVPGSKFGNLKGDGSTIQGVKTQESFIQTGKEKFLANICVGDVGGESQCLSVDAGRRGIDTNDEARNLVDNANDGTYTDNLFAMADQNLTGHQVAVQPWSSDYWPIASGHALARREIRYPHGRLEFHDDQSLAARRQGLCVRPPGQSSPGRDLDGYLPRLGAGRLYG